MEFACGAVKLKWIRDEICQLHNKTIIILVLYISNFGNNIL